VLLISLILFLISTLFRVLLSAGENPAAGRMFDTPDVLSKVRCLWWFSVYKHHTLCYELFWAIFIQFIFSNTRHKYCRDAYNKISIPVNSNPSVFVSKNQSFSEYLDSK